MCPDICRCWDPPVVFIIWYLQKPATISYRGGGWDISLYPLYPSRRRYGYGRGNPSYSAGRCLSPHAAAAASPQSHARCTPAPRACGQQRLIWHLVKIDNTPAEPQSRGGRTSQLNRGAAHTLHTCWLLRGDECKILQKLLIVATWILIQWRSKS
jgi:hypothetical protein